VTIGLLEIDLGVSGARSLKDKRHVVKSLKDRLRSRFNCSVAEIEFQDVWTRARLAVCVVSGDSRHANSQLNEIAQFVERHSGAELLDYRIEML
jgi:hypothetical protein